ncbi:hypothetical protein JK358_33405 [Nocardia sp. 2]|uniref:WXG100 family type VII secretion target n=1 Tax=Nocardia acididurans TaxID=2802282 RepID=A0ABS1MI20_9NOCA|nr:hypothetical protein [Nocardia acididurans]MBL1079314.1 hypothetical protein [Nocardia acididurans]
MTVLDVAPQAYYDAATACNNAASGLMAVFQGGFYSLRETSGMAGSVGDGKIWADSYDAQAQDLWKMSLDMVLALDGYAQVLNQAGYNHALADHDAAAGVPEPQQPTLNPAFTGGIDQLIFTLPTSAGGDGRGIVDDGLELAAKVGIPIPDGDTAKLNRATELWNAMATHASVTAVATELERAAAMFEQVTSPDANFIDEDLRELKTAASDLAGAYGEMSQSCSDQKTAHDDLRKDLEQLLRDLAAEIAIEVAVNLAISVLVSCVSFGVGAAAVAAKTAASVAKIIDKFADLIKKATQAAKLRTAVEVKRITTKTKETIQRVKDLSTKLVEKLRNAWNRVKAEGPYVRDDKFWDDIKATQDNYPSTELPRSFEMQAGETRVWVHGNATEHMAEYLQHMDSRGDVKSQLDLVTQVQMKSLQAAIDEAGRGGGLVYDQLQTVGGWELKFGAPREAGQLPVVVHALYRG